MISYSDHVLSQKPWGYWPLSDKSLTQYDELHTIIDCSGNQRHLTAQKNNISYEVDLANFLHDSLPLSGISIGGINPFSPGSNYPSKSGIYYTGTFHINDVVVENPNVSHLLYRKRMRAEVLLGSGIVMMGNIVFTNQKVYHRTYEYRKVNNVWRSNIIAYQIGTYSIGTRYILDIEWIDNRNVILTAVVGSNFEINRTTVTLPEFDSPTLYHRFDDASWYNIAILYGSASNLSVFYEKELTSDYVVKSWQALSTPFIPSSSPMIIEMSDNVDSCKILDPNPNSASHQLDTLLVRGFSQRVFSQITTSELDNGNTEICLWLNTIDNEYGAGSQVLHDFKIGDIVSIDGLSQTSLNGCWRIERLGHKSVYFSTVDLYNDEDGYFLIKRAPIGGGAWSRNLLKEFISSSSEFSIKMVVNDSSKTSAVLSLKDVTNSSVILRRFFKRSSSYYQGADLGYNRVQWSMIGDDRRFVFIVAYKQNPKTHCRVIVFGDIADVNDDQLKTVLIGYNSDQMGDVGFNKVFEYFNPIFSDKGILHLTTVQNQTSDIGWIYSNKNGDVDYLHGVSDCGQHRYPVPVPFS